MTPEPPRNLVASIKGRLDQLARKRGENIQITHIRYGVERFLHRLSKSPHRSRFVLKGAMLFTVWGENQHRPTRNRAGLEEKDFSLEAACLKIERFVMPAARWARAESLEDLTWTKSQGWDDATR